MAWILTLLKGLWPWRGRRRSADPPGPIAPPAAADAPPPEPDPRAAAAEPANPDARDGAWDEDEPEEAVDDEDDADEDDADEDDALAPDPFVSVGRPAIAPLTGEELERRRAEARATALARDHTIYLSDAAGPGSLAEALNRLLQQGLVTAEYREGAQDGPHLVYRPAEPAAQPGRDP